MLLCDLLRRSSKRAGLTQYQIAKRLEVTRQLVCGWFMGHYEPPLGRLRELSTLLKVPLIKLVEAAGRSAAKRNAEKAAA
jgi:transcriptional regulator with XRE-family HTH domain